MRFGFTIYKGYYHHYGEQEVTLQEAGRWNSLAMPRRYIELVQIGQLILNQRKACSVQSFFQSNQFIAQKRTFLK